MNGIKYSFLPLNTMLILGVMGVVYALWHSFNNTEVINRNKLKYALFWLFPIAILTLPSMTFIGSDFFYIRDIVFVPMTNIFGAYFVALLVNNVFKHNTLDAFIRLYILAILLQCALSLLMLISPEIQIKLMNLIVYSDLQEDKLSGALGFRAIGFGIEFFGAGIIMSIGLILCVSQFYNKNLSRLDLIFYIFSFIFILSIGTLLARTTLVGAIISLLVFLYMKIKRSPIYLTKLIGLVIFMSIFLFLIKDILINSLLSIEDDSLRFALEIFINMVQGDGVESKSTSVLLNMYDVIPNNLFTWIFGDGYYRDLIYPLFAYYKGIDVGYLRIIFAIGILGLIAFIMAHFKTLRNIKISNKEKNTYIHISLIVLLLVLLSKGVLVLVSVFALFSFARADNGTLELEE